MLHTHGEITIVYPAAFNLYKWKTAANICPVTSNHCSRKYCREETVWSQTTWSD